MQADINFKEFISAITTKKYFKIFILA